MIKKIIVGISGAGPKSGCTHTVLTLANFLKNRGIKTAILECNDSGHFEEIREATGQIINNSNYFTYNSIDYYPFVNSYILSGIIARDYQFIIIDFGSFHKRDRIIFEKTDIKIITCGSRPWETSNLYNVFNEVEEEFLKKYIFFFNFTHDNEQTRKDIINGMNQLKNVYFPEYTENPFVHESFPGAEKILDGIYNLEIKPEKTKPFSFWNKSNTTTQNNISSTEIAKNPIQITEPKQNINENIAAIQFDEKSKINKTENTKEVTENNIFEQTKIEEIKKRKSTVNDSLLLEEDSSTVKKKGLLGLLNKKEEIPLPIDITEGIETIKNLSYTQNNTKKILELSRELLKEARNVESQESKLVNMLSFKIFHNAFCASLRSGEMHKRENGKDGSPSLVMFIDGKEYSCNENIVINIVGENDKNIISPYEDNCIEF